MNEVPDLVKVKQVNEHCTGCFFKWSQYPKGCPDGCPELCTSEKIIFKQKKGGRR